MHLQRQYRKIFTYEVPEELQRKIRYHAGLCELTDVTGHLTDILALPVDIVVINTDTAEAEDVELIREYERDADDPYVKYYYLSEKEIEKEFG